MFSIWPRFRIVACGMYSAVDSRRERSGRGIRQTGTPVGVRWRAPTARRLARRAGARREAEAPRDLEEQIVEPQDDNGADSKLTDPPIIRPNKGENRLFTDW